MPLPIVTPRLRLRRFTQSDGDEFQRLLSDEEHFAWVRGFPANLDEDLNRWLNHASQMQLTMRDAVFPLAIELQAGAKLIGSVALWFPGERQGQFEITIHAHFQRQKYGMEAVDGLLGFCFAGINLHRVSANCLGSNTAARRLFETVGMRCEGEFVKSVPCLDGQWENSVWFAALEEEYDSAGQ